jgi:hypothetical protein
LHNDEAVAFNAVPMMAQAGLAGDVHLPGRRILSRTLGIFLSPAEIIPELSWV